MQFENQKLTSVFLSAGFRVSDGEEVQNPNASKWLEK